MFDVNTSLVACVSVSVVACGTDGGWRGLERFYMEIRVCEIGLICACAFVCVCRRAKERRRASSCVQCRATEWYCRYDPRYDQC